MNLNEAAEEIHNWACGKGFWDHATVSASDDWRDVDNPSIVMEKLMLVVTEVAEAAESERDGDTNTEEEIADAMIRLLDICGYRGYDIEKAITDKMVVNHKRPHMHGRLA